MEPITEFQGPTPDDYANVTALNTAFIKASSAMKGPQRGRLATTPFLLFSLRERDLGWWQVALETPQQTDFTAGPPLDDPAICCIQTAALGFLWHLAARNPYAARIISGATVAWCELVTALPLVSLLDRVGHRGDLLRSRLDADSTGRLLGDGTSAQPRLRRSSQLAALQALLTDTTVDHYRRLPAAACTMSAPPRVQDKKI